MIPAKNAASDFAKYWKGRGYEKGETTSFWTMLLQDVYGLEQPSKQIVFERQVDLEHKSFIDALIPATRVLIEQKSIDKDLRQPIQQSDGTWLTPFQQAKRYADALPFSEKPRWIVACNFKEFLVYDMENPSAEPESILLENLPNEYWRMKFLVDANNEHIRRETEISIKAGELVGRLYDLLYRQYKDPEKPESAQSLNRLCVRLVFCLYAEDADVFPYRQQFYDYMKQFKPAQARRALIDLFEVLDQKEEDRDPYIDETLAAFPYVNGGLFAEKDLEIPNFTDEILQILLEDASADFDWSRISPTIFGAVFESTLNPETRRSGGMHYTSVENIHKVIDPLFLDELKEEFRNIRLTRNAAARNRLLTAFQDKLGALTFFDPACGSGNFLTETYVALRKLENDVLRTIYEINPLFSLQDVIKVSIQNFYGIEINDFAVTVAKTAMWIAELQMIQDTRCALNSDKIDFLPLKAYANIHEGNALRRDWNDVVRKDCVSYIIGNPPFVGYSFQTAEQKEDVLSIYTDEKGKSYNMAGKIDYVSCWYFKAAQYMQNTSVRAAFVSTNSISQGDQVAAVWEPLFKRFGIHIDFAYRSFVWNSEASIMARVHCIIVGFSVAESSKPKLIFNGEEVKTAKNINPYLIDAPSVFVKPITNPLCNVPPIMSGNRPTDDGNFSMTKEEKEEVLAKEPELDRFIKRLYGAEEYINNKERFCFWLVDASPSELRKFSVLSERLNRIREYREKSSKEGTRKSASTPWLFQEIRQPKGNYLFIPRVSSERRTYVPIGFLDNQSIPTDAVQIVPEATLYHFGVITSYLHMTWMRAVCGRLKSDYRYSNKIVYNNYPWPEATDAQREGIEEASQEVLTARSHYADSSLADLYDPLTMPPELLTAHRRLDKLVERAYRTEPFQDDDERLSFLFERYLALTKQ